MKVESTPNASSAGPGEGAGSPGLGGHANLAALEEASKTEPLDLGFDFSKQLRRTHMPMGNKHKFERYWKRG
jgi:hypothetical protein